MKLNIEIDCTPEEARRFLGLPDLSSLHEVYLGKMGGMVAKGITPDVVQSVVKNWAPMGEAGINLVSSVLGQFAGGNASSKSDKGTNKGDDGGGKRSKD